MWPTYSTWATQRFTGRCGSQRWIQLRSRLGQLIRNTRIKDSRSAPDEARFRRDGELEAAIRTGTKDAAVSGRRHHTNRREGHGTQDILAERGHVLQLRWIPLPRRVRLDPSLLPLDSLRANPAPIPRRSPAYRKDPAYSASSARRDAFHDRIICKPRDLPKVGNARISVASPRGISHSASVGSR